MDVDEAGLEHIRTWAAVFGPAQRAVHDHMRRFGRYDDIDAAERCGPQARQFTVAARLLHIVSEAAESFEAVRDPATSLDRQRRPADDPLGGELADIILHTVDLAEDLGIDLGEAIGVKMDQMEAYARRPRLRF